MYAQNHTHKIWIHQPQENNHPRPPHTNWIVLLLAGKTSDVAVLLRVPNQILWYQEIRTVVDGHGLAVFHNMRWVHGRYFKARDGSVLLQGSLSSEHWDNCIAAYITAKVANQPWILKPCCTKRLKFDKRTPGLFKLEFQGEGIASFCSKSYISVSSLATN